MKLDNNQVKSIARLARLELSEEEVEKYGRELSAILDYVGQLDEVDVLSTEPTAQVTGLENVFREDAVEDWREDEVNAALNEAPEREGRFIKTKKIL